MINSSSVNEEMARKKGCVRMALNIYHISTEENEHLRSKRQVMIQMTPVCHY